MVNLGWADDGVGTICYVDACDEMVTEVVLKDTSTGESITAEFNIEQAEKLIVLLDAAVQMAKVIRKVRQ